MRHAVVGLAVLLAVGVVAGAGAATLPNPAPGMQPEPPRPAPVRLAQRAAPGQGYCYDSTLRLFYAQTDYAPECATGDTEITKQQFDQKSVTAAPARSGANRQDAAVLAYCHDARIGLFYTRTTSGGCGGDRQITQAEYERKRLANTPGRTAGAAHTYCYDRRQRVYYAQTVAGKGCAPNDKKVSRAEYDLNTSDGPVDVRSYCRETATQKVYRSHGECAWNWVRITRVEYYETLRKSQRARNQKNETDNNTAGAARTYCYDRRQRIYYAQTAGCAPNDREISRAEYDLNTSDGPIDKRSYCLVTATQKVYRARSGCLRGGIEITRIEYYEQRRKAKRARNQKNQADSNSARARRAEAALQEERRRRRALEEQVARLERERDQESQPRNRPDGVAGIAGTGILVNNRGIVLTNAHVVSDCRRVTVRFVGAGTYSANVVTKNSGNDLAILRTGARGQAARFRAASREVQMGEEVLAFGFPLSGFLSSQGNLTRGDISATTGIRDDVRFLQISAPVQPGNSGGPLMDVAGNVVGVVTAKADATKIAEVTGDIPQNVNFAITGTIAMDFLRTHRVTFDTANDTRDVGAPRVAELAQGFAPYIECWQ